MILLLCIENYGWIKAKKIFWRFPSQTLFQYYNNNKKKLIYHSYQLFRDNLKYNLKYFSNYFSKYILKSFDIPFETHVEKTQFWKTLTPNLPIKLQLGLIGRITLMFNTAIFTYHRTVVQWYGRRKRRPYGRRFQRPYGRRFRRPYGRRFRRPYERRNRRLKKAAE